MSEKGRHKEIKDNKEPTFYTYMECIVCDLK